MNFDLTVIWAFIIVLAVFIYVVLDGFDLGIGILFGRFPVGPDRDTAMNSIAPVWDGNETWLVLGGGGLLAAFPLAYGLIFSALYAPIIAAASGTWPSAAARCWRRCRKVWCSARCCRAWR